jgi:pimeloyl-ACP methyl ester carboxylesterase
MSTTAALAATDGAAAGGYVLTHRPGLGPLALDCWMASPERPRRGARPLVAVHGIGRGARDMAEAFAARAAAQGRVVIAPLFDEARWNGYQRAVAPRRADRALLALVDELADEGVTGADGFDLFGYSGGAQFAHRFAMLFPRRICRLSVCAAGWWTLPDAAEAFPYGLGGAWGERLEAGLDRFLSLDIAVSVGADDDQADAATRSGPALDARQGRDRVARARAFASALRDAAARRGLPEPRLSLTALPGCGHDFLACARAGLVELTLP